MREDLEDQAVNLRYDERLRNLDDKLERLLKEVEELKDEKKPKDSKESSARLDSTLSEPGRAVAF